MGTRCGDVDPGLLPFLAAQGMTIAKIDKLMNKQSGLLGLCGHSDLRTVEDGMDSGDPRCRLAFGVRGRCMHAPALRSRCTRVQRHSA
jgi:acetate kinase